MPTYPISNVTRRVVYDGSAGVGPYAFTFEILAATDIAVYKNSTLLTLTTNYTVTINANGTGSVTLTSPADIVDSITIIGNRAIQRTTDFVTGGDLFANTLNDELDSQTIFVQQVAESVDRSIKVPVTDGINSPVTLPSAASRATKVVSFNTEGEIEAVISKGDIQNAASNASTATAAATSAAASLANFNGIYYGPFASAPALDPNGNAVNTGDLYYDTSSLAMRVYNGSFWEAPAAISPITANVQTFSGDGSTTSFVLSSAPPSLSSVQVFISGVSQVQTTVYGLSGSTLTFVAAPPSGTDNILVRWASAIAVGVPNDGSVTTAKLQDDAVTSTKIADGAILPAKLSTGGPSWTSGGVTTTGDLSLYRASAGPTVLIENGSTNVLANDIYGSIDFRGNDSSANASGVRSRISCVSAGTTGAASISFSAAGASSTTLTSRLSVSSTGVTTSGTFSVSDTSIAAIRNLNNQVIAGGGISMLNTDTQIDLNITPLLVAGSTYYVSVDVVATYYSDPSVNAVGARLFKNWAQAVSYSGTTWQIQGAVLKHAAFNTDATNFPAGAVNASKALLVATATDVLLRMQNHSAPAATSQTYYDYYVSILLAP